MARIIPFLLSIMVALAACAGSNKSPLAPESPVIEEGASEAAKLVVTDGKAGGGRGSDFVSAALMTAIEEDGNYQEFSVTPSSVRSPVMSLVVYVASGYEVVEYGFMVKSSFAAAFQNARLYHYAQDGSHRQIGATLGTIQSRNVFQPDAEQLTPQYEKIVLTVDARSGIDVATMAAINRAEELFRPYVIVRDSRGKLYRVERQAQQPVQKVRILPSGSLEILLDPTTPINQTLAMGQEGVRAIVVKCVADEVEDGRISNLSFAIQDITPGAFADFIYSRYALYHEGVKIGEVWSTAFKAVDFRGLNLVVPANTTIRLTLVVDVRYVGPGIEEVVTGSKTAFSLLPGSVVAKGMTSAASMPVKIGCDGRGITSNTITVYGTKITAAWSANQPGSNAYQAGADDQLVKQLVVSNYANTGNYSAMVRDIIFGIAVSDITVAPGVYPEVKLYKDSVAEANLVGVAQWRPNRYVVFSHVDVEIAAGTSRNFVLTMDTNQLIMKKPAAMAFAVPENGIVWQDGVGSFITGVQGLPLDQSLLTYE